MIEFGKTLRTAREAKGYTIGQIADLTRMSPTTITDLEEENFSRIAAPIYGRGFVKLYCTAVGIDAQPLVKEFMDIYEGNRDLGIRERVVSTPPPAAAATEEPIGEIPPVMSAPTPRPSIPTPVQEELLPSDLPPPVAPRPAMPRQFDPPPQPAAEPEFSAPAEPKLSRYATPMRLPSAPQLSPAFWRICLLSVAGIALLVLMGMGIRALYRATGPKAETVEQPLLPAMPKPTAKTQPAAPRAPRTPMAVPNLYVD